MDPECDSKEMGHENDEEGPKNCMIAMDIESEHEESNDEPINSISEPKHYNIQIDPQSVAVEPKLDHEEDNNQQSIINIADPSHVNTNGGFESVATDPKPDNEEANNQLSIINIADTSHVDINVGSEPVAADPKSDNEEGNYEHSPLLDPPSNNSVTSNSNMYSYSYSFLFHQKKIQLFITIMTLWCYIPSDGIPSDDIILTFCVLPLIRSILVPPLAIRILIRIQRLANKVVTWRDEHQALIYIIISTIGMILFICDMGSDVSLGVFHYNNGDYIWFTLTIVFVAAPAIPGNIETILAVIKNNQFSVAVCCVLYAAAVIIGPLGTIGALVYNLYNSIRQYPNHDARSDAVEVAAAIKLFEVCLESYPQAALQMFIAFQTLEAVTWLTWVTISFSLITLSFGIATSALFTKAPARSKLTFFILGIVSSSSRVLVCCVWSLINKYLWFLVFGSQVAASIIAWGIINWRPCSICPRLHVDHRSGAAIFWAPMSWLLTVSVNSITMGGLVVSTTTLVCAIVGCFLEAAPLAVSITALTLSALTWVANICMLTVEQFEGVKNDYLVINHNGESDLY